MVGDSLSRRPTADELRSRVGSASAQVRSARGSPLSAGGDRVLVGADDGGVDLGRPVDVAGRVALGLDLPHGSGGHAVQGVAAEAGAHRLRRAGRSHQETLVRILQTAPLMIFRSSTRGRPVAARGGSGASNSRSWSVSSWRRVTATVRQTLALLRAVRGGSVDGHRWLILFGRRTRSDSGTVHCCGGAWRRTEASLGRRIRPAASAASSESAESVAKGVNDVWEAIQDAKASPKDRAVYTNPPGDQQGAEPGYRPEDVDRG